MQLTFEANQGQTDPQVQFVARGAGYTLFLTPTEAVMSVNSRPNNAEVRKPIEKQYAMHSSALDSAANDGKPSVIRMQFAGANPAARIVGMEEQPGIVNYFTGNDSAHWRTNIPTFARVEYQDIYPGINLIYYGNQEKLEYDFEVAARANPNAIAFSVEGSETARLDGQGNLVLQSNGTEFVQHRPYLYQEVNGARQDVSGSFVIQGQQVGFQVGQYDLARPLVIDPVLSFSTYLGGNQDDTPHSINVDSSGNIYVVGTTSSLNFPVTSGGYQRTYAGGLSDAFVTKLNPTGSALIYSTYLGGNSDGLGGHDGHDTALGLAIDAQGFAYVAGETGSTDFPTTAGALQRTFQGGDTDGFVTKLNQAGSALVYSTFLGGSFDEDVAGIAVDSSGNAYVVGDTTSIDFPTTASAFQRTLPGEENAFMTKLNSSGSALVYSTYLGGTTLGLGGHDGGTAIAIDSSGNAYVTGFTDSLDFPTTAGAFQRSFQDGETDAFVAKLSPSLSGAASLVYSTYLGGDGNDNGDGIAVDAAGNAYVVGTTDSGGPTSLNPFPTTPGAFQRIYGGGDSNVFVSKVNPSGSDLVFSTFVGGSGADEATDIAVDSAGNVYVTGDTNSPNFPTANAIQSTLGGLFDAFVTKLNPAGSALVYSTYLGGSGDDAGTAIALDSSQNVVVAGTTTGNFPTTPGAFQQTFGGGVENAFIAKLGEPGLATHFRVAASVGSTMAGAPFSITVTALDAQENVATGYRGTVTFSSTDGRASLPGNYPFNASDNGVHQFVNLVTLVTAGAQTVTATDTITMSITGTSPAITVTPAPAASFAFDMPSTTLPNTPFTGGISALDPYGNIDTNYGGTVTFTTTDPDPGVVVPQPYTFSPTDAGVVYFPNGFTLVTVGDQFIYANDTGTVSGSALVTVVPGGSPGRGSGPRGPGNRIGLGLIQPTLNGQIHQRPLPSTPGGLTNGGIAARQGSAGRPFVSAMETVRLDRYYALFQSEGLWSYRIHRQQRDQGS